MATKPLMNNGVEIDKNYFTEYNQSDKNEILAIEYEIKAKKLKTFCHFLLANNDFFTLEQLLKNNIEFFKDFDALPFIEKSLDDIVASAGRIDSNYTYQAIENIIHIQDQSFVFIRDLFMNKIVRELYEGENNKQSRNSLYFEKILIITQNIVLLYPEYLSRLDNMILDEVQAIKKIVLQHQLDHDLTKKSSQDKKIKL